MKINIGIHNGGRRPCPRPPRQGLGIKAHQRPLYKNNSRPAPALAGTGRNVKFKPNQKIYKKFPLHLLAHYIVICVAAAMWKGGELRGGRGGAGGELRVGLGYNGIIIKNHLC